MSQRVITQRDKRPSLHLVPILLAALACVSGGHEGGREPSDICAKLVAARVAKNCTAPNAGPLRTAVGFEPAGVAGYKGTIYKYLTDADFAGFSAELTPDVPGDYPVNRIKYAPARTIVSWTTTNDTNDRWDACRTHRSVVACAKEQPTYYAAFKSLSDAAGRAVTGK